MVYEEVARGHADLPGDRRGRVTRLNFDLPGQIDVETQLTQIDLQGMQTEGYVINPHRPGHVAEQPPGSLSAQLPAQRKR